MIRFFDIIFSILGLLISSPLLLLIYIISYYDCRSPLFFQERVGKFHKTFILIKFRTMKLDVASVASHLSNSTDVTRLGVFLRYTKLDELPQLWNVLKGDMSLVGPRPCLKNQIELINLRDALGVFKSTPGITGLGQINNIDMSEPELLAEIDAKMLDNLNIKIYFGILICTILGKGFGDRIGK